MPLHYFKLPHLTHHSRLIRSTPLLLVSMSTCLQIEDGSLGSPAGQQLMGALQPKYWFSAHMHTKFPAIVPHTDGSITRFLALDKCLPGRDFL
jgi:hypothetical protein